MAFKTATQLVTGIQRRISQVQGTAVQTYSEDRLLAMAQEAFDFLFTQIWWPQFMSYQTGTLDGSTGKVTSDWTTATDYFDIRAIWESNNPNHPLPEAPRDVAYTSFGDGTRARFYEPIIDDENQTRLFRVLPLSSTGTVIIHGRAKPADMSLTSQATVKMEDHLIINYCAWSYLADDGTNPGATDRFQVMFENRLAQIKAMYNSKPIILDPHVTRGVTEWWTP